MRSLLVAIVAGLVGAVVLHIVIILSIPHFAMHDAWSKVTELGEPGQFYPLANEPNDSGLYNRGPYLRSAICIFHAGGAPVRIMADGALPFWSLAVYDRHANELYSMNDRSAVERQVDVTLATPLQMIALRRRPPAGLSGSILVEIPKPDGFVVLRTIAEDDTFEEIARAFLADARCSPVEGL